MNVKLMMMMMMMMMMMENISLLLCRKNEKYFFCSLIPTLFFEVDNLHHDSVILKAKEFTMGHLNMIVDDCTSRHQPTIQGLTVPPFDVTLTSVVSQSLESALSRVISLIVENLLQSTNRHVMV